MWLVFNKFFQDLTNVQITKPTHRINDAYFFLLFDQYIKLWLFYVLLNSYCWCLAGPAKFSKASQRKNFENHWFRVWMQCDHHVASPALNFCETITAVFYVTFVIVWLFSQSTLHIEALRTLISLWAKQCNKSVFYWNKNKLMTALSRRHFYDNTELQLSKLQTSLRYNKLHFDASNCSRKLIKPMFDQYIDIQEQKQKMFVFFSLLCTVLPAYSTLDVYLKIQNFTSVCATGHSGLFQTLPIFPQGLLNMAVHRFGINHTLTPSTKASGLYKRTNKIWLFCGPDQPVARIMP